MREKAGSGRPVFPLSRRPLPEIFTSMSSMVPPRGRWHRATLDCQALTAGDGKFSLQPYPAVRTWLARVERLPGWVPLAE